MTPQVGTPSLLPEQGPIAARPPRPQVAKPERRQDVKFGRLGAAIVDRDLDEDVLRRFLGVLDEHVEVAVLVEDPGIDQLVLELVLSPAPVRVSTRSAYGNADCGILVQVLHVRVRRRAIQVEVVLLDVLAVIALALVSPKSRSLRIGSEPFQSARAKQSRCL